MKVLARICLIAAILCPALLQGAIRSPKSEVARNLDIFNALVKELQMNYVDTIEIEKLVQTAINAMLSDLDPYTEYMPRKEQTDFVSLTTGEYGGIGSYIRTTPRGTIVAGPQAGSPAEKAGLRTGDLFIAIDTTDVTGWPSDKVTNILKGVAGSDVTVKVIRPYSGADSIRTFNMRREKIMMPSVPYYGRLKSAPEIGYVSLTSFTEKTAEEMKKALEALKSGDTPLEGVVLDLRGNGGGIIDAAVATVGYFVDKGTEVVRTRGRGSMQERIYKTTVSPILPSTPLAVLIDNGSASSAEITAGALQDLDRAVILGSRSFGKGLVQTGRQLPDDGLLKVTIARYYIPSGRLIQAIDYSHRNPDGSVQRIPDSLTTVFHTLGGREVRDGGGITPDSLVTYPDVSRLTYNVVRDDWAFDFATKYAAHNKTIAPPADFTITDTIYSEFKGFIDPKRFHYDRVCEEMLKQLREAARIEGYMNDSVSAEFDRLGAMLRHSLDRDLDTHRAQIEPYLAREIVNRYYGEQGEAINSLNTDPGVAKATDILRDTAAYRRILHPKAK